MLIDVLRDLFHAYASSTDSTTVESRQDHDLGRDRKCINCNCHSEFLEWTKILDNENSKKSIWGILSDYSTITAPGQPFEEWQPFLATYVPKGLLSILSPWTLSKAD